MFLIVANQMVVMFIMILVGCLIRKINLIDHDGSRTISNLLLLVVNPCVLLNSFTTVEYDAALVHGLLYTFVLAIVTHAMAILAARILLPGKEPDTAVERFSCVYSNCGFMGIPVVSSILGAEGVFYISAYLVVFNFLVWTHGMSLLSGDTSLRKLLKGLRSPVMFTMTIGIVCYFLQIHLPGNVQSAITYISRMNTPLGMFVAGAALAEAHPLQALKKERVYRVCAVKLFVVPMLANAVMMLLHPAQGVYYTIVVAAASPAATTCTMMAIRCGKNYRYASELYVITTLLSMLTIPAVVAIAQALY